MTSRDGDRWRRADALFEQALELPLGERPAFLARACGEDGDLRREVESLLAHDVTDGFLDVPAADEAARLLAPHPLTGRRIGAFEVLERIGGGGMGEVYAARDTRLGRRVAIKLLPADLAADPERARRFHHEALAVSALNHPNILTVHGIVTDGERDLLVTELVEGVTLRECMRAGALPLAAALDLVLPLARGLSAAHAAGIVHRDVKPENVMIRGDGVVKLIDFGIAKSLLTPFDGVATAIGAGLLAGTPGYMSPEQARGLAVDPRTDVWSLGVVLYELVTGEPPFAGPTASDRLAAILGSEPEPPSRRRPELPPALDRALGRALAKDPARRYADAAQLALALEELRSEAGRMAPARPPERGTSGWLRRAVAAPVARIATAAVALIGIALLLDRALGGTSAEIDSLAVLPFEDRSDHAAAGYLGEGISDGLIRSLGRVRSLRVMSRASAFPREGESTAPREVGRRLGVRGVIVGHLARRGDRLEVGVELVDARDGSHIWGAAYDRPREDLVSLHEEIARDLLRGLRVGEQAAPAASHRPPVEAYQLYLQGLYFWHQAWRDVGAAFVAMRGAAATGYERSRDFFQSAVEADPEFALAWSGLAHYYAFGAANGLLDATEAWPRAEHSARRAIELDPALPDAYNTLAGIKLYRDRDWSGGERELARALDLGGSLEVLIHYSFFKLLIGQTEEALRLRLRALELDPLSLRVNLGYAETLRRAGRLEEAVAHTYRCIELDPRLPRSHELLGELLGAMGRNAEAIAAYREALRLRAEEPLAVLLENTFERAGYGEAIAALARHRLAQLEGAAAGGARQPAIFFARAHLLAGDREKALVWAARAFGERNRFVLDLASAPVFAPLRSDPGFLAEVERLGLPHPAPPAPTG